MSREVRKKTEEKNVPAMNCRRKQGRGKKTVLTVLRYFLIVILSVVIGYSLYTLNAERILGNQMPMPFGYGIATVMSGSMEPELQVGDLVFVREFDASEVSSYRDGRGLKEGEIIVFESEPGSPLIIHRIVEIKENREAEKESPQLQIITRGDANNIEDAPINADQVHGKLVKSIPKLGSILMALKNPAGIIGLFVSAILLLEIGFIREKKEDELDNVRKEIERLKRENEKK